MHRTSRVQNTFQIFVVMTTSLMKEKTHLHKNQATMVSKKAKSDETLY